jgi:acetyltransferase-like isoleucine patch superfamily enzyme
MISLRLLQLLKIADIHIGKKVNIDFDARIDIKRNSSLEIGNNVFIDRLCSIHIYRGGKLKIGNNVHLSQGVVISCNNNIEIGDYSLIGQYTTIVDSNHTNKNGKFIESPLNKRKIKLGKNVWVGCHSIILGGADIKDNAIVGANVMANHKIQKDGIYIGGHNESLDR